MEAISQLWSKMLKSEQVCSAALAISHDTRFCETDSSIEKLPECGRPTLFSSSLLNSIDKIKVIMR